MQLAYCLNIFLFFAFFMNKDGSVPKFKKIKIKRLDLGVVEHLSMKWVVRRQRPDSPQPKQDAPELFSGLTAFNTLFPPQKKPDCPLNLIRLLLLVLQVPNQLLANYLRALKPLTATSGPSCSKGWIILFIDESLSTGYSAIGFRNIYTVLL